MTHGLFYRVKRAARQIGEQHAHLDEILRALALVVERGHAEEARALFQRYRHAIDAHFSLEEGVFFPALRGLHPGHARDLELLAAEHAAFLPRIDGLVGLLESDPAEFGKGLRDLVRDLSHHESREERLVRELTADSPRID